MPQESGNIGYIRQWQNTGICSLGGVPGTPGRGRILTTLGFTVSGALGFPTQIVNSNPRRIALIIQNLGNGLGTGGVINIFLGDLNQVAIVLGELGTLQIDADFPWTGAICASAAIDGNVLNVNEVSVP